jgi:predicted HicB family RNase H-like nuclease
MGIPFTMIMGFLFTAIPGLRLWDELARQFYFENRPASPISGRSYSGKFIVRIPPEVHRALAIKAAEQGISLNRFISARLAGS